MFVPSLLTFGNLENRQEMSKDPAAVLALRRAVLGAGGGRGEWARSGAAGKVVHVEGWL